MKTPITFQFILATFFAVIFTWLIHEFAHWMMGEMLGYDMNMSLNQAGLEEGTYVKKWHSILVSMAGPFITICQALVVFIFLTKRPAYLLFPFLLTPFYMRLVASGMNMININDEGKISQAIGLGTYTIPIIVSAFLLVLVWIIVKKWMYRKAFIFWTVFLIMIVSSALILVDQNFQIILF